MDSQSVQNASNMYSLPDEVIVMILQNCAPGDILNFSATCKHYYEVIKNHNSLWKYKCLTTFSPIVYKVVEEACNGDWLGEMKYYYELKHNIHSEIIAMSPKYYWILSERSLDYVNLTSLFTSAIATSKNFFYVIYILQDLIETGSKLIDENKCIRPYTLTDMYYSKTVLRHLMHASLAIKWAKAKEEHDLPPEVVVNFFLQWVDPSKLHLDETAENQINVLVKEVNETLEGVRKSNGNKKCNGMQIINAVSHVIYKKRSIVITGASDLNTLDICKTTDNKCGNVVIVAALYQAVAARCGSPCELIVFPNHLFLEWRDQDSVDKQQYNIDLGSGKLYRKRQCPYPVTNRNPRPKHTYSADALLHFMYSSFIITMGALKTWNLQNALLLLGFVGNENEHVPYKYNPYKNYYAHLMSDVNSLINSGKPDITQLTNEHIQLIISLANLNKIDEVPNKPKSPRKHSGCVKFAVGMICYHKRYDYICIVRGWELTGSQLHFPVDDLYFGRNQPFYYITAADQSERYVAQENLMEVTRPTRLYHLEHQISRDFTHFDGFAYVLNDQKKAEYPEDEQIVEVFRALCRDKPNNI